MIDIDGVHRRYVVGGQTVHALDNVQLSIASGEFVAVTGASGSGKSSLLNLLGCLDRPDAGHYRLEGQDIAQLDDEATSDIRNRRIGFVFQSFHLLPRLTVLENVLLPLRFSREQSTNAREHAETLLGRVGLSDRLHHRPNELSGGQMQRAAIARALLMRPALLLADEPTGNLDSRSAEDVLTLFEELHANAQTIVLVTHDGDIAARAQRRIRLHDGKVEHDSAA